MIKQIGIFGFIFCGLVLLGCSKSQVNSAAKSKIQIQLPHSLQSNNSNKLKTMSASTLQIAVINVSAPDLGVLVPLKMRACEADCSSQPPSVTTIEVTTGSDRLIQLFATYGDSTTSDVHVFYGEVLKDLFNAEETVNLQLSHVATSATDRGNIYFGGRYMDALDSGPTGQVDMIFHPNSGSRPMNLGSASMLNGFFKFNLVAGAKITYELNGTKLFDNYDSAVLDGLLSDHLLKVIYPAFDLVVKDSGGTITEHRAITLPTSQYVGVYGPADKSNHRACFNSFNTGSPVWKQDFFSSGNLDKTVGLYNEPTGTTELLWQGNVVDADHVYAEGGVASGSDAICTDPAPSEARGFWYDPEGFKFGGIDGTFGFKGPFALQRGGDGSGPKGFVGFDYDSAAQTLSLSWEYIPGIQNGDRGIDGVAIFRSTTIDASVATKIGEHSQLNCQDLRASGTHGFQLVEEVPGTSHVISSFSATEFASTEFLFCPYWDSPLGREYLDQNVDFGMRHSGSVLAANCQSGCGGYGADAKGIRFTSIAGQAVNHDGTAVAPTSPWLAPQILAYLHSNGNVTDADGNLFTTDRSKETNISIFRSGYDPSGVEVGRLGAAADFVLGDDAAVNLPVEIMSIAFDPDSQEPFVLLHNGEIAALVQGVITPISTCPFKSCTVPVWMQSFSIGQKGNDGSKGEIHTLDHAGNRYTVDNGVPTQTHTGIPLTVTQIVYF